MIAGMPKYPGRSLGNVGIYTFYSHWLLSTFTLLDKCHFSVRIRINSRTGYKTDISRYKEGLLGN